MATKETLLNTITSDTNNSCLKWNHSDIDTCSDISNLGKNVNSSPWGVTIPADGYSVGLLEDRILRPEIILMEEYRMNCDNCAHSVCRVQLNREDSEKLIRYYEKNGHTMNQPFQLRLSAAMKSIPTITDVKSYDNKTTVVFFSDGTKEHANCSDDDTYSLEYGISICLLKKLLGGNETYKKIVNTAAKSYREKLAAEEAEKLRKKEEHEARMKEEQAAAKRKKESEARREAEETEKQIEIMAEAFRRAMQKNEEVPECPSEE